MTASLESRRMCAPSAERRIPGPDGGAPLSFGRGRFGARLSRLPGVNDTNLAAAASTIAVLAVIAALATAVRLRVRPVVVTRVVVAAAVVSVVVTFMSSAAEGGQAAFEWGYRSVLVLVELVVLLVV